MVKQTGQVFILILFLLLPLLFGKFPPNSAGTRDFIQYYSSLRSVQRGENPYDPKLLKAEQERLGSRSGKAVVMWNPPWTLVFFAPLAMLSFENAAALWFGLNLILPLLISSFIWGTLNQARPPPVACLAASYLFYPLLGTLYWGQLSGFVCLGIAGFLWAIQNSRPLAAALFFTIASVKPHISFLFFAGFFIYEISEKRWRTLLSCSLAFLTLLALSQLIVPEGLENWYTALTSSKTSALHVQHSNWKNASLASALRLAQLSLSGELVSWPLWLLPTAGFLGVLYYFAAAKNIYWPTCAPILVGLSLITAPYGWLYDQYSLVIGQVVLVSLMYSEKLPLKKKQTNYLLLIGLQAITICLALCCLKYQHNYFWFPPAFLIVYFLSLRTTKRLG